MKSSLLLILLSLLVGCATRSVPPADIYTITPAWIESTAIAEPSTKSQRIIKLAPIRSTRAFTVTDILYSDVEKHAQNSYAYSRWSDAPVRLLQLLFQTTLENCGQVGAVVPSTSASEADMLLESTLYDFNHHLHADGRSSGVMRIRFYLINNRSRTVISTKEFESRVAASSRNAQGATIALNEAANNVARELVTWLSEQND